jgi:hypothetical protein
MVGLGLVVDSRLGVGLGDELPGGWEYAFFAQQILERLLLRVPLRAW